MASYYRKFIKNFSTDTKPINRLLKQPYLYGREFEIQSDHNPLVYMDNMKNETSRVSRWRYALVKYNYRGPI
jgi:hypothetical protein